MKTLIQQDFFDWKEQEKASRDGCSVTWFAVGRSNNKIWNV